MTPSPWYSSLAWVLPRESLSSQAPVRQSPETRGELSARQESQLSSKCFTGLVPMCSVLWTIGLHTVNINFTLWFQCWCCQVHLLFVDLWLQWCYQSARRKKKKSLILGQPQKTMCVSSVYYLRGYSIYVPTQGIAGQYSEYFSRNFFY